MVNAQTELAVAKTNYEAAQRAADGEHMKELAAQLEDVEAKLAASNRRYEELAAQKNACDAEWRQKQGIVLVLTEQLRELNARKPVTADALPDAPRNVRWRNSCERVAGELQVALEERDRVLQRGPNVNEIAALEDPFNGSRAELERRRHNLINMLTTGGKLENPKGALRFVGA